MVRVRRIRTREEIEADISENERVNGVPEGPEDHASKKRRLSRLSSRKCKLNKELRALLARESEQEAVGTDTVAPVQGVNLTDAERQRLHRSRLSAEEQIAERMQNTQRRQQLRVLLTPEQQANEREQNTQRRQELRREMTVEEQEVQRVRERARREAEEEEMQEARKEALRIRRKCVRHGHALANHEVFDKTRVSGKNVEDGHHNLPDMYECGWCGAWKWPGESQMTCCLQGKVQLPPLHRVPDYLHQYYDDPDFRRLIRAYNQVFAFTSVGAARSDGVGVQGVNEDRSVQGQRGVYTYRIQGAMGHYLGSLLPRMESDGRNFAPAKFAQIYIVDGDLQRRVERRKGIFADLDCEKLTTMERMMQCYNPFAQQYLSHGEKLRQDLAEGKPVMDLKLQLFADKRRPGTTNLPTANEVGAVMIDDGNFTKYRDLLLYTRQNGLLRIFETNPMYDPLQYPLLFPLGELGWTYTDKYANGQKYRNKEEMSLREHVAYRLFPKPGDGSVLHSGGRLFQQWSVDQRAKVEQEALTP